MNPKRIRLQSSLILLSLLALSQGDAFNQGSLFVFDILSADRETAAAGRIAVSPDSDASKTGKTHVQETKKPSSEITTAFTFDLTNTGSQSKSEVTDSASLFNTPDSTSSDFDSGWRKETDFELNF